jgi:cold shock CspA family protein
MTKRPAPHAEHGVVKFYRLDNGWGYIIADNVAIGEIFVHASGLARPGPPNLQKGDRVEFEIRHNARGPAAVEVQIESSPADD